MMITRNRNWIKDRKEEVELAKLLTLVPISKRSTTPKGCAKSVTSVVVKDTWRPNVNTPLKRPMPEGSVKFATALGIISMYVENKFK